MAQRVATVRGQITDPLGAVITTALVTLTDKDGKKRVAKTDERGTFRFSGLAAGVYTLQATAPGFVPYKLSDLSVAEGLTVTHDLKLMVAIEEQKLTVDSEEALSTDPNSNKGARVIKGQQLNALSDDPDELAEQLSALSGPAAGPNGAQIYIDGFATTQRLPDKQSIQEIVINRNPFSAEHDRMGFGRIEITTKPGSGKLHGGANLSFNDAVLNSRNPYASNRPSYQRRIYGANFSGPLGKKATLFTTLIRRVIEDPAVINATILDDSLNVIGFSAAVPSPRRFFYVSPRVDFQLNNAHTLSVRYSYDAFNATNQGIGGYYLASRGQEVSDAFHILQVVETAILSTRAVNEARFQFMGNPTDRLADDEGVGINVLDAFSGGGGYIGRAFNRRREWVAQDYITLTAGRHTLKLGVRLGGAHVTDTVPTNIGSYTFAGGIAPQLDSQNRVVLGADGQPVLVDITSIDRYRRTLLFQLLGLSPAEIRAMGGGATQLTIATGSPVASVSHFDFGVFVQDDWKLSPSFTLSFGLRYQGQTNIEDKSNFGPRAAFAWTPWSKSSGQPRTVIRGGFGIFYDLVRSVLTLQANRYNGINQQQFLITDPLLLDLFPVVPSESALKSLQQPQTIVRKAVNLTAPYYLQSSISIEHKLPRNAVLTASYLETRGVDQLRSRNVNAPLPGTVGAGDRPFGTADNIYEYNSDGVYQQHLLVINSSFQPNQKLSANASYTLGFTNSNTDGVITFPANTYDQSTEFGRAITDFRHRFTLTGTFNTWKGISINPLLQATSGPPFNIITGLDDNGDSLFTDRPAFATDLNKPSVRRTPFGAFDLQPALGARIIPRNFGRSAAFFATNLRISKTFTFGGGDQQSSAAGSGGANAQQAGPKSAGQETRSYQLNIAVYGVNIFNRTNPAARIGNLASSFFGTSNALHQGLGGVASTNRSISLSMQLTF